MSPYDLPKLPQPSVSPNLFLGAASPLWGYFGAAAAGGLAYWWMTRWTHPQNLEALFAVAARAAEPVLETAEATIEAVEAPADELPPPVGGESAPVSPLVAAAEPVVEPPATVLEAAPEPVAEDVPEPLADTAPEPALKPRLKKGPG